MTPGAKLNRVFWDEIVLTATYIINVSPTRALKYLKRTFGSTIYVCNKLGNIKFYEKSMQSIFIGPNEYKVWDVEKFIIGRDVIFDVHFCENMACN